MGGSEVIQGVSTPDGKYTTLLADWQVSSDVLEAAMRVVERYDALDVLPMLGVQS